MVKDRWFKSPGSPEGDRTLNLSLQQPVSGTSGCQPANPPPVANIEVWRLCGRCLRPGCHRAANVLAESIEITTNELRGGWVVDLGRPQIH
jgi:hypothetical protein